MKAFIAAVAALAFVGLLGTGYIWMTVGSIQCRSTPSYIRVETIYVDVPRDRIEEMVEYLRQFAADRDMTFGRGDYSGGMTLVEVCNRTIGAGIANPFSQTVFSVHLSRNADRPMNAFSELSTPLKDGLRRRFREVPPSESGEWTGP